MKTVHGACPHDCPDTCAWQVTVDDAGRAVGLAGTEDHPYTRGALCSKLKRYPERVYSAERLLHPMRRNGPKGSGQFERIGWDEALAEIVARLEDGIARHGPLTAMPANFAGTVLQHNVTQGQTEVQILAVYFAAGSRTNLSLAEIHRPWPAAEAAPAVV